MDSSSPRYGEKASCYSAVCLETGEVEWMELDGNSNSGTSAAFLEQLRERHSGRLNVIWDNAPAHRGEAVREYLRTPGLNLRLMNLPGYSPDFNADEAIWGWTREEATGNLCLGTREAVNERVSSFLAGLASRKDEVRRRCRTVLQSKAEALVQLLRLISAVRQMHIPPWLWFSFGQCLPAYRAPACFKCAIMSWLALSQSVLRACSLPTIPMGSTPSTLTKHPGHSSLICVADLLVGPASPVKVPRLRNR